MKQRLYIKVKDGTDLVFEHWEVGKDRVEVNDRIGVLIVERIDGSGWWFNKDEWISVHWAY